MNRQPESNAMRFPIRITENLLLEPVLHMFGVRPDTSFVELDDKNLTVSMGRWFHETIPLSEISAIAPSDWPWWGGFGVRLAHHGVGVLASTEGIATLTLKAAMHVHILATRIAMEQLWLSLEDPAGFLAALSAATGLAVGPHKPF